MILVGSMVEGAEMITYRNGVFIANFDYANRHIPKNAGFWWHPGTGCRRKDCPACAADIIKKWWTADASKAYALKEHCTPSALAALKEHEQQVAASRAVSAEAKLDAPEGLSYLPFQKAGIYYALQRKNTLIADEMGLGKTIQALGILNAAGREQKVLVVCPAPLRLNWQREAQKWLVKEHSITVVDKQVAVGTADMVICNYDRLKGVVLDSIMERSWDVLVVDEAHYLKNGNAQRTKAVLGGMVPDKETGKKAKFPGIVSRCARSVFLTGTPILNRPIELYTLLHALAPQDWGSKFTFGKRYCDLRHNGFGYDWSGASNLEELQEKLRGTLMVRRLKAEVLTELPAKRRQVIDLPQNGAVKVIKAEAKAWEAQESHLAEISDRVDLAHAAGDKEAYAAAVAQLRQGMAKGLGEVACSRKAVALAKVKHAVDHVKAMLEEGVPKVVVWAHHHEVLDALSKGLGGLQADGRHSLQDRQTAVDQFQNIPDERVIVCGIRAMGEGHTLTAAAHEVFVELDYTPGRMSQCEDRCHRIGQVNSVLIQHLVFDGTIDANIAHALVQKQNVADKALDDEPDFPVVPLAKPVKRRQAQYPVATPEERDRVTQSLRFLAGLCDGAIAEDGVGFNGADTRFGKELAARSTQRALTDGEVFIGGQLIQKYHRQLGGVV